MDATHVLHVGEEYCHRAQVLRTAGYAVEECETLHKMASWFRHGRQTDLVCISEEPDRAAEGAIAIARTYSVAPIVLFRATGHTYFQESWDLEIPPLTPPEDWLNQLAHLLALTRANVAASRILRERSRLLREQCQNLRRASTELRAKADSDMSPLK